MKFKVVAVFNIVFIDHARKLLVAVAG